MKSMKVLGMALLGMSIIMASCSGEDGKDGLPGDKGDKGAQGDQGPKGDQGDQGDQGDPGADGQDGSDKPNVDFYFQEGFKGYTGTQDAVISDFSGDSNDVVSTISFVGVNPANDTYTLMRFDGISDMINQDLVESGEACDGAFELNQATLYVYIDHFETDAERLYFHLGFYNENDPLFDEAEAFWEGANPIDEWGGGDGGYSSQWVGPFPGSDDYAVVYPVTGTSGSMPGWFALPLPRSIVKDWICNDASNKGFRIRLAGDNANIGGIVDIYASEIEFEDLRPLLVIETEDIDPAAGKMAPSGKAKDWDNMSYEEKMAPLYRYFAAKGL